MLIVYLVKACLALMLNFMRYWSQYATHSLSVALPSSCALCGANDANGLCSDCNAQFFNQPPIRCAQCANRLPTVLSTSTSRCGSCLKQAPAFDATWVVADYAPPLDRLVLSLKFTSQLSLAPILARLMFDTFTNRQNQDIGLPDIIIPMPLAPQRLSSRGFNQSLEIARPFAHLLKVPLTKRLAIRVRETSSQSLLPLKARAKNVRGAFTLSDTAVEKIRGKHIGVVDDVMTSGTTLSELARTLKRFGAGRVSNFVVARAPF